MSSQSISQKEAPQSSVRAESKPNGLHLDRTTIKYIAIAAMVIDHVAAHIFFPKDYPNLIVLFAIMRIIGRTTGPIMFYFLAEGFAHTSSKLKYGVRLLCFALASQVPFALATYKHLSLEGLNVMMTLFLSFVMLAVAEKMEGAFLKGTMVSVFVVASIICDWSFTGPLMVWFFYVYRGRKKAQIRAYLIIMVLEVLLLVENITSDPITWPAMICQIGMLLPIPLIMAYDGTPGKKTKASKWAFYIFYPLHLLLIWLLWLAIS